MRRSDLTIALITDEVSPALDEGLAFARKEAIGTIDLRVIDGRNVLAPKSEVEQVGIGTRVRMVFTDIAPGLSLPQWTIDESTAGGTPWRYQG